MFRVFGGLGFSFFFFSFLRVLGSSGLLDFVGWRVKGGSQSLISEVTMMLGVRGRGRRGNAYGCLTVTESLGLCVGLATCRVCFQP